MRAPPPDPAAPLPSGGWALPVGAGLIAAAVTAADRWALLQRLRPALYSPEELLNARVAVELLGEGALRQPLWAYQHPASAGGSLWVSVLHLIPAGLAGGPSELTLKAVAVGFAAGAAAAFAALGARAAGVGGALLLGGLAALAPLGLSLRQATALGNHAELNLLVGLCLLAAHAGRPGLAGLLAGLGGSFDPIGLLLIPAALWAAPPGARPRALGAALIGLGPAIARFGLPVPPPSEVHGAPITALLRPGQLVDLPAALLQVPALSPALPPAGAALRGLLRIGLWAGAIGAALAPCGAGARGAGSLEVGAPGAGSLQAGSLQAGSLQAGAARAAGAFALLYLLAHTLSSVQGVHVQTALPLGLGAAGLLGLRAAGGARGRQIAGAAGIAGALGAALGGAVDRARLPCAAAPDPGDTLPWARALRIAAWTPAEAPGIAAFAAAGPALLGPGAAAGFGRAFQLGLRDPRQGPSGAPFAWRVMEAFDAEGAVVGDLCVAAGAAGRPSGAALMGAAPADLPAAEARAAGWGLGVRAAAEGADPWAALRAAPAGLRADLAHGLGLAAGCGGVGGLPDPPAGLGEAARAAHAAGLGRCGGAR